MRRRNLRVVVIGLSLSSSWGNGHATTYRALLRALDARMVDVTFFERDVPWYRDNRDLPNPSFCSLVLYRSLDELVVRYETEVAEADVVIIGSYVPEGVRVAEWVLGVARGPVLFYDIDTPVTLAKLARDDHEYLAPELVPRFDVYLSFTGGPTLDQLEEVFGARRAVAFYCSCEPTEPLRPANAPEPAFDLGYLGTYSLDRQPALDQLLLEPARRWSGGRFVVAGPQYPAEIVWPKNVTRLEHVKPGDHPAFYGNQRFTLNITRVDMKRAGWSPSVRLFEAAACGTPIVSDTWPGIDEFFVPGEEIILVENAAEALDVCLHTSDADCQRIAARARARVLAEHTAAHRAAQLEHIVRSLHGERELSTPARVEAS